MPQKAAQRLERLLAQLTEQHDASDLLPETLAVLQEQLAHQRTLIEQLRTTQERLALALDAAEVGVWDWDLKTNTLTWDARHERIFGVGNGRFDGHYAAFNRCVHPEDRQQVAIWLEETLNHKQTFDHEFRVVWPDGTTHRVHAKGRCTYDMAGKPERMIGTVVDLAPGTATADAEARDLARLPQENPNPVLRAAEDGWLLFANGPAKAILEELGWHEGQRLPEPFLQALRRALDQGQSLECEVALPSGRFFLFVLILSSKDRPMSLYGREITARKAAETQLRLRVGAIDSAANGIALTDEKGTILWTNRAFAAMTGYSLEELIGRNPRILKSGQQDEAFYRNLWQTIRQGRVWHGELVNRRKDGTLYHEEMTITPVPGDNGKFHYVAVKQDITERKRFEQELLAAKEAAEAASKAKDQFLAVLSHELRTPLAPVLTTAQMMECRPDLSVEDREMIALIRRNVEVESKLIDDLLNLTRIMRGKLHLNLVLADVHTKLRYVVAMFSEDIHAKHLELAVDMAATEHVVQGDAPRLQQVFWNLLKNAIKFTPEHGRIVIRTANPDRGHIEVAVTDTGVGIEPAVLPRIFDAFEQGSPEVTRQFGGLGLGLAISKGIVEMHGGTIHASSSGKGHGATFTVTLPVTVAKAAIAPSPPAGSEVRGGHCCSVLLVEDHPDTRKTMSRVLRSLGCTVQAAQDVAEAKEALDAKPFDVLISDIGLPDGTGLDVVRHAKAAQPRIRSIALSGYGMEEDIRRSMAGGFDKHLIKPVDLRVLEHVLQEVSSAGSHPTGHRRSSRK